MQQARFLSDKRLINTTDYLGAADTYRGLLLCPLCGEKAWFIKAVNSDSINRAACFGAHHQDGCDAATLRLNVNNLLDKKYLKTVQYGAIYGAPRTAALTLEYQL